MLAQRLPHTAPFIAAPLQARQLAPAQPAANVASGPAIRPKPGATADLFSMMCVATTAASLLSAAHLTGADNTQRRCTESDTNLDLVAATLRISLVRPHAGKHPSGSDILQRGSEFCRGGVQMRGAASMIFSR